MLQSNAHTSPSDYLSLLPAGWMDPYFYSMAFNDTTQQTIMDYYYFENNQTFDAMTSRVKPAAYECALFFCVKRYTASMNAGRYSENIISTWPDAQHKLDNFPDITTDKKSEPASYTIKNVTLSPPNDTQSYVVDTLTFALLRGWLYDYLGRGIDMSSYFSPVESSEDNAQALYQIQKTGNSTGTSGAERMSSIFADGLTLAMRTVADTEMAVEGDARENKTFVKARWIFAILPIALVVATSLFMAATLAITVRHGVPVWKSSALATLAHGLRDESSACITADRLDLIEHKANTQRMTVEEVDRQWRFAAAKT